MIPLRMEWRGATDVGAVREVNEDRFFASEALGVWAIADGMGGMARGDWAATQVIEELETLVRAEDLSAMAGLAGAALERANARILAESETRREQMGTTAVVLLVRNRDFSILWVGDSRGYLIRDGQLHRLTRDHSQVRELIDRGLLDEAGAATHPLRNVLTRAIGVSAPPLGTEMIGDTLEPDDLLLLCSDGLYGAIGEAEIATIVARERFGDTGAALIARCLECGAPDNVTLILVRTNEATVLQFGSGAGP